MVITGAQLQQQALVLHQRLLQGDPTASLDVAELLLDPLVDRLRTKWPGRQYVEACHDAAVEVIVAYLGAPTRYDPVRSALLTWLVMQAHGDLINAYNSSQGKFERDWIVDSALSQDDPDGTTAPTTGDHLRWHDSMPSLDATGVLAAVRDAFPDERDRQLIWLMCVEGVHSTDAAAAVLGLAELPPAERVAEVRRNRDRVMRRLRRLRLERHDE